MAKNKRSRKTRRQKQAAAQRREAVETQAPEADSPPKADASGGDDDGFGSGGNRPATPWLLAGAAAFVLIAIAALLRNGAANNSGADGVGDPQSAVPQPTAHETPPPPLVNPADLQIPNALEGAKAEAAQRALAFHGQAYQSHAAGDDAAFAVAATAALQNYSQAGWVPSELGGLHHELISLRFEQGDEAVALREGSRWLQYYPEAIDHHQLVGMLLYRSGKFAEAASHFESYATQRPLSLRTQRQLASSYAALGDSGHALAALDRAFNLLAFPDGSYQDHPELDTTLQTALRVSHRCYDYDRLALVADALLKRDPDSPQAHMARGVAARHQGDYTTAEGHLRHYLERADIDSANRGLIQRDFALVLMKQGHHREAFELLVEILLDDPHHPKAYFQLAQCLSRLGHPETARPFYARARQLAPVDREKRRAIELRGIGERALALRADAVAARLAEKYAQAEALFEGHLASYPDDHAARTYFIEHLLTSQNLRKAKGQLATHRGNLGDSHPDVIGWDAQRLLLEFQAEAAAAKWEKLCQSDRQLAVWGVKLARLYLDQLEAPAKAQDVLRRLLEAGPDPTAQHLLARALLEGGDAKGAAAVLERLSPADKEWAQEVADLTLLRCRIALADGGDSDLLTALKSQLQRSATKSPGYYSAIAEWMTESGKAFSERFGNPASALIERDRARAAQRENRRTLAEALAAQPPASTKAYAQLARRLYEQGQRDEAMRVLRSGAHVDRSGKQTAALLWEPLHQWLDRDDEVFMRAAAEARLAAASVPGFAAPKPESLARQLLGDTPQPDASGAES